MACIVTKLILFLKAELMPSISEFSLIYLLIYFICLISILLCANYLHAFFKHACSAPWSFWKNIAIECTFPNRESLCVQNVYRLLLSARSICIQGQFLVVILSPDKIQSDICINLLLTNLLSQSYNKIIFSVIQRHFS